MTRRGRPRHDRDRPDRRRPESRLVVGLHPVRELLRAGRPLHRIHLAATRDDSPVVRDLLDLARRAGVPVVEVERHHLDDLAPGLVHQGVVAEAPAFRATPLDEVQGRAEGREWPLLLVALDGVTDPHNLGSIARTAEAVGADGLLVPSRRSAAVTPVAEKAAAGALAHLPLVEVTNLVRALRGLQQRGVWVVGLDGDADTDLADCPLVTEPVVLVVGAEGRGLARLTRDTCDQLAALPMRGQVGSYNASVAAAMALYETLRQRGGRT